MGNKWLSSKPYLEGGLNQIWHLGSQQQILVILYKKYKQTSDLT